MGLEVGRSSIGSVFFILKGPYFKAPYPDPTTGLRYHNNHWLDLTKHDPPHPNQP